MLNRNKTVKYLSYAPQTLWYLKYSQMDICIEVVPYPSPCGNRYPPLTRPHILIQNP
jgi:hypothetical protein